MKLGEIISKAKVIKCKDKDLPVLSITLRDGFVLQSSHFKKEIASKDKSNYNVVKKNQLVQSIHIDEGGFSVQYIVDEGIVSPAYKIWDVDIFQVNPIYLNTFLRSKPSIAYYKSKLRGTIHRRGKIDDSDILGMEIPVPSLSEQKRIIAELDLLQGIIDKQKAQLTELDTLAQSIFYDMFGDPIVNDKRWPIKRLDEICENLDYLRKPITASEREKGIIPYYGASGIVDYVKDFIFDGDYLLVSEDGANLQMRHTPIAFSISGKSWVNNHAHVLLFSEKDTQRFIEHFIALFDISEFITGAVQPKLTQAKLNGIRVPLPPLSLQHAFASKIKAIERQKASINASIAETQKLFDYTMDKYFG